MISYLILTPPGGPDRDHRTTRFVADRFAWLAFVFPGLWLLFHRCWLIGVATLIAQVGAGWLTNLSGLFWAGTLAQLAIGLLIGLEGRHIYISTLIRHGWMLSDVVSAPDLSTAEAFYFSSAAGDVAPATVPTTDWSKFSAPAGAPARGGPALGLFDIAGGR
ncbi:DUF2628 domain-containing protein [Rhizobium sp. SAFR-030]|uniref:DUF2628 domain-containing protein n=1 Tax=Rhizobium sp. SAFR-030 TaxID=3387277 RepID=UPI003F7EE18C